MAKSLSLAAYFVSVFEKIYFLRCHSYLAGSPGQRFALRIRDDDHNNYSSHECFTVCQGWCEIFYLPTHNLNKLYKNTVI